MRPWDTKGRIHARKGRGSILFSVVLLLLGVCATVASAAEKVLTIAYSEEPKTSDMQMNTDDYLIPLNVYDRLLECATVAPGKSALLPGLATKWETSKDGKVYTFMGGRLVRFDPATLRQEVLGTYPDLGTPIAVTGPFVYGITGTHLVRFKLE